MKWKFIILGVVVLGFALQCSTSKTAQNTEDRVRQLKSDEISRYHDPLQLEIAWIPYIEHSVVHSQPNEWRVVKNTDTNAHGELPMILLTYPGKSDTLFLDMSIDNETLGRLIKHSLMTEVPINRPFTEFIEISDCRKCHPDNVAADLK